MPQFERQGSISEPITTAYPPIRGGVCDFCGILDNLQPSYVQYQLCPHFKGMGELQCSYCPATADPIDVIRGRKIMVHGSPTNPNQVIAVCDDYKCSQKHLAKFKMNA